MLNIINNIIKEYIDVTDDQLTKDTNPVTDLHLNSYDFISIIGRLENDLGIEISERDLRKIETLGQLDEYIKTKMDK